MLIDVIGGPSAEYIEFIRGVARVARAHSPAEALLKDVLAQAVNPALKAAKFRKSGGNYHRRHGETVHIVNVQVSHGSTGFEKTFYINVGVAFDALCELAGMPVRERPKEYQCDRCGIRGRSSEFIPGAPEFWTVGVGQDIDDAVSSLGGFIQQLIVELDQIDGLLAYRSHRWFDRDRPAPENAQVLYVLGDLEGARREVQDLATAFADRENADRADWWVERLRLSGLRI